MKRPNMFDRDFDLPGNRCNGNLEASLLPNNMIHVQVSFLHENRDYENYLFCDGPAGQGDVVVKYPENADLYQTIMTIFNKLTEDHQFYLRDDKNKYKDHIFCFKEFVQANLQLPYIERNDEYGWGLLELIPENMKYLGIKDDAFTPSSEKSITIYGEVFDDGTFIYDNPVISRQSNKKYYEMTRGKLVWCVQINPETKEYEYDPEFDKRYQEYVDSLVRGPEALNN